MTIEHGGDLKTFSKESGKPEELILDFSSNINPLGVSPAVRSAYFDALPEISKYPDNQSRGFRQAIARFFSADIQSIAVGNGSIALIELLIRVLRPKRALLIEPCFLEYQRLLSLYGAVIQSLVLKETNLFEPSLDEMLQALHGIDLVMICHPNNPTGTCLKRADLLAFIRAAEKKGVFVLVDEAFADWRPEISVTDEINGFHNLAVVRSMTKFYALAGIRSGFAISNRKLIEKMQNVQETWSCNGLAQILSPAALEDQEYSEKSLSWFREESDWFFQTVRKIPEFKIFPSAANFFLMKLANPDQQVSFWQGMKQAGIYLRSCGNFQGLGTHYFRAGIRLRQDNLRLIETIKEIIHAGSYCRVSS